MDLELFNYYISFCLYVLRKSLLFFSYLFYVNRIYFSLSMMAGLVVMFICCWDVFIMESLLLLPAPLLYTKWTALWFIFCCPCVEFISCYLINKSFSKLSILWKDFYNFFCNCYFSLYACSSLFFSYGSSLIELIQLILESPSSSKMFPTTLEWS